MSDDEDAGRRKTLLTRGGHGRKNARRDSDAETEQTQAVMRWRGHTQARHAHIRRGCHREQNDEHTRDANTQAGGAAAPRMRCMHHAAAVSVRGVEQRTRGRAKEQQEGRRTKEAVTTG